MYLELAGSPLLKKSVNALQVQQFATDASATKEVAVLEEAQRHYQEFNAGLNKFRAMFREENDTTALRELDLLSAAMDEMYDTAERMTNAYIDEGQEAGNIVMDEFDVDATKNYLRETQGEEAVARMEEAAKVHEAKAQHAAPAPRRK